MRATHYKEESFRNKAQWLLESRESSRLWIKRACKKNNKRRCGCCSLEHCTETQGSHSKALPAIFSSPFTPIYLPLFLSSFPLHLMERRIYSLYLLILKTLVLLILLIYIDSNILCKSMFKLFMIKQGGCWNFQLEIQSSGNKVTSFWQNWCVMDCRIILSRNPFHQHKDSALRITPIFRILISTTKGKFAYSRKPSNDEGRTRYAGWSQRLVHQTTTKTKTQFSNYICTSPTRLYS